MTNNDFISHLLLQVNGHLNWRTPKNRSIEYVTKIANELGNRIHLDRAVDKVQRNVNSITGTIDYTVTDVHGIIETFDLVVFACHPDQILKLLGNSANINEINALNQFHYSNNDTYVHCDSKLMPKSKSAWTSWNYLGTSNSKTNERPVFVTYWLNKLQHLNHSRDIFVTLNPTTPPDVDKTYKKINYSHPQYTKNSVKAQRVVASLQGTYGSYYCGAWMGYGFHEDGIRSGLEIATLISGEPLNWVKKYGLQKMIPAPRAILAESQNVSLFSNITNIFTLPIIKLLQFISKYSILTFLKYGFSRGKLNFQLNNNKIYNFCGKQSSNYVKDEITIHVYKPNFWVRLALEADLGMAKSYINGEFEIENTGANCDGLTKFLLLLIDNMPNGKYRVSGGIDANKLITAWFGSAMNWLWFKLIMDNSIANSRSNIHAVSNSFYY